MRPWRAAQARRRPGYPHSNQRPLEPEPPPTPPHPTPPPCVHRTLPVPGGPRVRGALLKQTWRPGFTPSARRVRSLPCPSRAGSEGACQVPYFCQESLVSPIGWAVGHGAPPFGRKSWVFLHSGCRGAQVSALPREGLGSCHPTQAGSPYSARKVWGLIAPLKLGGGRVTFFLWTIMCQSGGLFSLCQARLRSCCLA